VQDRASGSWKYGTWSNSQPVIMNVAQPDAASPVKAGWAGQAGSSGTPAAAALLKWSLTLMTWRSGVASREAAAIAR
jgi:hypothetical protein